MLVNVDLPDAASVQRTQATLDELVAIAHANARRRISDGRRRLLGRDGLRLVELGHDLRDPRRVRTTHRRRETQAAAIIQRLNASTTSKVLSCQAAVFGAPPVPGLGQSGGFQLQIDDRTGLGIQALQEATETVVSKANAQPGLGPRLHHLPRQCAAALPRHRPRSDQADGREPERRLHHAQRQHGLGLHQPIQRVRPHLAGQHPGPRRFPRTTSTASSCCKSAIATARWCRSASVMPSATRRGPVFVMRYNNLLSAAVNGDNRPGFSSGQAISVMDQLVRSRICPPAWATNGPTSPISK